MARELKKHRFAEDVECESGYCSISKHDHDHSHDHNHDHEHGESCDHNHDHNHDHEHGESCDHDHDHDHSHNESCGCNHDHDHNHDHGESCDHDHDHAYIQQKCSGPNVDIGCGCGHDHGHSHSHEEGEVELAVPSFIIGAVLFVIGLVTEHFPAIFTGIGISQTVLEWATFGILLIAYILVGKNVLLEAGSNILKGQIFDENFLMSIASLGAFVIGEYPEAVGVMIFYNVGEYMQGRAVTHSKKSITALMDIRPDVANIKVGGGIKEVAADSVKIDELIVVRPGEKVPLDGIIAEGESAIDTKALTGESMPVDMKPGDEVLSGSINGQSLIAVKVTKVFAESTASKIIDMVENASNKKAKTENFITVFARYYTPAVVGIAALLAILPPVLGFGPFSDWIYRGLVFLVVSCPCALVISIPLGFFGGIGAASSNGILVKGGNYLEALNKMDTVVFDKTGTLTTGEFKVRDIIAENGFTEPQVLKYAAYAEANSTHPIGVSIVEKYLENTGEKVDPAIIEETTEKAGHGVSVRVFEKNVIAGNERLMEDEGIDVTTKDDVGTIVYIALDGVLAGHLKISDEIKVDSANAIAGLKERGIDKIVMLTGDTKKIADKIGEKLGLSEIKSQLLPNQKVEAIEEIISEKERNSSSDSKRGKVGFVGDGINDAPVLARADIGIAMGGVGSDAAIEAADIVIMNDEPSKIPVAVDIARKTKRIVWQNIVFALGVKVIVLVLAALGLATMWAAVFADVGVALIATANSVRAGRIKKAG